MFDRFNLSLNKVIAAACKDSLPNPPIHKIIWTTHQFSLTAPDFNDGNTLTIIPPSGISVDKISSIVLLNQSTSSFSFAGIFDKMHFFQSEINIPYNASNNPVTFFVTLDQINYAEDLQLAQNSSGIIRISMKCGDGSWYSVCIFDHNLTPTRSPINFFRLPNNGFMNSENYSYQMAGRRYGLEPYTICVRYQNKIYFWNWHIYPYTNLPFHEFSIPSTTTHFKTMRLTDYIIVLIENTKIEVKNFLDTNQVIFKLQNIDHSPGEVNDFCWGKETNNQNHFILLRRKGVSIHTQCLM